jgi:hypothetical protein
MLKEHVFNYWTITYIISEMICHHIIIHIFSLSYV